MATTAATPVPLGTVRRTRWRATWRSAALYLGVGVIVLYCLAPFYWMAVSSLKAPNTIFDNHLLPVDPSLENYRAVFGGRTNFSYALRNSLIIAATATVIAVSVGILTAYALVRLSFRGKRALLGAVLATAMFPGVAIVTPLFHLFSRLGWIDHYQAMIIPDISFALPLSIWILTGFFAEMPWELEEAARIDGCTRGRALRYVMLPLAAPALVTTGILVFIQAWNEYLIASIMSQTLASQPVTVAIAKFAGESQFQQPFGTQMAAGIVVTIPLLIMVLLVQRRIVAGLTAGAIKG